MMTDAKQPTIADSVKAYIDAANQHVTMWLNIEEDEDQIIQVNANRNMYFLDSITATGITSITPLNSTEVIDPSNYFYQKPGKLTFINIPPAGYYTVKVSFDTTGTDVQADIKTAVFLLTQYWVKQDFRDSKSFGGETVAFTSQNTGMPKHIRTILELYRNI